MRLGILAVAVSLFLSACGSSDPSGRVGAGSPSPSPETSTSSTPSTEPDEVATTTVEVWLARGDQLHPTYRSFASTPGVGRAALDELTAGPTDAESDSGVSAVVPPGTELLDLNIADGVATADFSSEFEQSGGTLGERMRLAAVTFTLTQFPTVKGVLLKIDGTSVTSFGSHGIAIDKPMRRGDFEDLTPPIVVTSPQPGDDVSSPVQIAGTANVFEATVSIRIRGEGGEILFEGFTTATCGTGCRGSYSTTAKVSVSHEQPGVIEVFEDSAEDGSDIHMVKVPVTLSP